MPQDLITLPRSQRYELVWSKPVTEVAAKFGISDVALAKRCRALEIPLPPRGYLARVAAGQKPRRTPLPPFRDARERKSTRSPAQQGSGARPARERPPVVSTQLPSYVSAPSGEEPTIAFAPPEPKTPEANAKPVSPEDATLHARIDALSIAPLATLADAHPAVLRTAVRLKHLKSRDITWPRGTRTGPILDVTRVSEPQQERALRILDEVLRGAEALGWKFEAPPPAPATDRRQTFPRSNYRPPVYGHLLVHGEAVTLRIDERNRQSDHVMTEREKADKKAIAGRSCLNGAIQLHVHPILQHPPFRDRVDTAGLQDPGGPSRKTLRARERANRLASHARLPSSASSNRHSHLSPRTFGTALVKVREPLAPPPPGPAPRTPDAHTPDTAAPTDTGPSGRAPPPSRPPRRATSDPAR